MAGIRQPANQNACLRIVFMSRWPTFRTASIVVCDVLYKKKRKSSNIEDSEEYEDKEMVFGSESEEETGDDGRLPNSILFRY